MHNLFLCVQECLLSGLWPQAKPVTKSGVEQFKCPAHACHTCHAEHNLSTSTSLVTCIRCPTSYHDEDYCVAAGKWLIPLVLAL